MASLDRLQPTLPARTAQWRLHRFTRAADAADVRRALDEDVRAFFTAIVAEFAGEGRWMAATAPAKGGGVDVWFRLPGVPGAADFAALWSRHLIACGLSSQAVTGRN
jgi:hypothetical protein